MSAGVQREAFDAAGVERSPDEPGVYVLFHGDRTILIGTADESIRRDLESHRQGNGSTLTSHATSYSHEVTGDVAGHPRELELLDAYRLRHNMNVPRGNRELAVATPAPTAP
jgi:hypothetical protein